MQSQNKSPVLPDFESEHTTSASMSTSLPPPLKKKKSKQPQDIKPVSPPPKSPSPPQKSLSPIPNYTNPAVCKSQRYADVPYVHYEEDPYHPVYRYCCNNGKYMWENSRVRTLHKRNRHIFKRQTLKIFGICKKLFGIIEVRLRAEFTREIDFKWTERTQNDPNVREATITDFMNIIRLKSGSKIRITHLMKKEQSNYSQSKRLILMIKLHIQKSLSRDFHQPKSTNLKLLYVTIYLVKNKM